MFPSQLPHQSMPLSASSPIFLASSFSSSTLILLPFLDLSILWLLWDPPTFHNSQALSAGSISACLASIACDPQWRFYNSSEHRQLVLPTAHSSKWRRERADLQPSIPRRRGEDSPIDLGHAPPRAVIQACGKYCRDWHKTLLQISS